MVHMNIAQFVALSMGADPYKVCGFQTHSVPLEEFLEKNGII
jgi:heterodisulfide reductase subunit B